VVAPRRAAIRSFARHDPIAPKLNIALREARWLCGTNSVEFWEGILRVYPAPYEVRDGAYLMSPRWGTSPRRRRALRQLLAAAHRHSGGGATLVSLDKLKQYRN
jgi:hypothetical protein